MGCFWNRTEAGLVDPARKDGELTFGEDGTSRCCVGEFSMEASMRIVTFSAAAAIVVLASDAFAQTETPEGYTGHMRPPAHREPHTLQVRCLRWTATQAEM